MNPGHQHLKILPSRMKHVRIIHVRMMLPKRRPNPIEKPLWSAMCDPVPLPVSEGHRKRGILHPCQFMDFSVLETIEHAQHTDDTKHPLLLTNERFEHRAFLWTNPTQRGQQFTLRKTRAMPTGTATAFHGFSPQLGTTKGLRYYLPPILHLNEKVVKPIFHKICQEFLGSVLSLL